MQTQLVENLYLAFSLEAHAKGSNTASSYVTALKKEDYRLIFAPSLKEHYTNEAFKDQFQRLHGKRITMPIKFLPSQELLAKHREQLIG